MPSSCTMLGADWKLSRVSGDLGLDMQVLKRKKPTVSHLNHLLLSKNIIMRCLNLLIWCKDIVVVVIKSSLCPCSHWHTKRGSRPLPITSASHHDLKTPSIFHLPQRKLGKKSESNKLIVNCYIGTCAAMIIMMSVWPELFLVPYAVPRLPIKALHILEEITETCLITIASAIPQSYAGPKP